MRKRADKTVVYPIRLSPAEKAKLERAARAAGAKPSVWARLVLMRAAGGELVKAT
jgi:hypothetical protein